MLAWLRRLFTPPAFPDNDENTRIARLLHPILLIMLWMLGLIALAIPFIFPQWFFSTVVAASIFLIMLLARYFMVRGKVRFASQLFITGCGIAVALMVLFSGGLTSVDNVFFITLVVICALLLGRRATRVLVITVILYGAVLVVLDAAHAMPPRLFPVPPRSGLVMLTIALIVATTAVYLALQYLSVAQARSLKELAERKAIELALTESEQRFHAIFDSVNEAIFVHDIQTGAILDVNQHMCEMYGYSHEEATHLSIADLSLGEDPYTQQAALELFGQIAPGDSKLTEWHARDKNGRLFWVEINLRHTMIGGQEQMLVTVRDINERRKAEQRRAALYHLSDAAHASQSPEDFYQLIHTVIRTLMPAKNFFIALYEPTTDMLSYPYYADEFDEPPPPHKIDRGLTAYILHTGAPLLVTPAIFVKLEEEGAVENVGTPSVDWLGTPLRTAHGVIGVLAVQTYTEAERLTLEDQDVLVFISNQVAMLLERKQADEHDRMVSAGLRAIIGVADELIRCDDLDTLYRRAVELAREKIGLERVGLFILEPDGQYMLGTYGTDGLGNTTDEHDGREPLDLHPDLFTRSDKLWYVRHDNLTYWEGDKRCPLSPGWVAGTAIRSLKRPLGALFNDTAISKAPLNETTQETVAVYCSLLGNIIERKRLEERERIMAHHMHVIVDCADELLHCDTLDNLYRRAVELAREKIGVERVGLFLMDPESQLLAGTYGTDMQAHTTDEHFAREPVSNHPYLTNLADRSWHIRSATQAYWEGKTAVPLQEGWIGSTVIRSLTMPIGVLFNDAAISQKPVDKTIQETLVVYCSLLGNIIERKRLEARERDQATRLHAIVDCADELIRCDTPDALYRRAVELAREKLNVERCSIFLLDNSKENLLGTYGTNHKRQTTDEHGDSWKAAIRPEIFTEGGQNRLIHVLDHHTYWDKGVRTILDRGWVAFTLIRVADQPIGVFCNDTAISHNSPDETIQETIAIYCSLLGNIIDRKRFEDRQRDMVQRLHTVVDCTDELIACEDLDTLNRRAVELAREKIGVERCSIYLLDENREVLAGTYGTNHKCLTTDEHFVRIPAQDVPELFDPRIYKHMLHENVSPIYYENQELHHLDQSWVAMTIIRTADEPIGVFYNDTGITRSQPNETVQETVSIYCSLLGNIIKRKRSEEHERDMAQHLHAVVDAADELIGCESLDTLYRRAVELARDRLKVERCSLYLLDENHEYFSGTYGTTERFQTSDEHSIKYLAYDVPALYDRSGKKYVIHEDVTPSSIDENGDTHYLGTGWVASTVIHIADEPIGVFYNDCAVSKTPPSETVQETLTIYCSLLGNIIKRMRMETEQKRLIGELENKNSELERFAYTVSHDLKSPLITIRGFLGFLEKDAAAGNVERLRTDMGRISDATNKMQQLLNGLLELSRVGRLMNPAEMVPFETIARDAIGIVQGQIEAFGAEVILQEGLPSVFGDRARLVEVVQNLLDNAVKFSNQEVNPRIEIGALGAVEDDKLVFFVRDNGLGIDPQFHERIFGLFNKLDAQSDGTGIGLALVKRIIEFHGGMIWVESEGRGRGSTFFFTLPITDPQAR